VLSESEDLSEAQVDVPLITIPAPDRIAGPYHRHLIANWGMYLR